MKWTEEEQELVSLYGLCPVCYAPRNVAVSQAGDTVTMDLVCTADPRHVKNDGPGVHPPLSARDTPRRGT